MGHFLRKEYIPTSKFKTNNEWLHHLLILNLIKLGNKERISNSDDEQEIGQVIEDKGGQEEGDQEEDQEEDQEGDQEGQEGRENEEMNEDGGGVDYYYSSEKERRLFESEGMKKYKKNK